MLIVQSRAGGDIEVSLSFIKELLSILQNKYGIYM